MQAISSEMYIELLLIVYRATYWNPVKMFSNVDFPAPDGPIIAVNSPDLNFPDTFLSICFLPVRILSMFITNHLQS